MSAAAAMCNTATDDSTVINAAIDDANAKGGMQVNMPQGTCHFATALHPLSYGTQLVCQGPFATTLTPTATMTSLTTVARRQAGIINCGFSQPSALATNAIEIAKDHDDIPAYVRGNFINNFPVGVLHSNGDYPDIEFNTCLSCGTAIKITNDGTGGQIAYNYGSGGQGIIGTKGANTTEKITVAFNQMISNGFAGHLSSCLFCTFIGNTWTQQAFVAGTVAFQLDNTTGDLKGGSLHDNFYGAAAAAPAGTCSAVITGGYSLVLADEAIAEANATNNGICVNGGADIHISHPMFDRTVPGAIDIIGTGVGNLLVDHASFYAALSIQTDAGTYGRLDFSTFTGTNAPVSSIGRPDFYVGVQGNGMKTKNVTSATISGSATSATFAHGVWKTPDPSQVNVVLTNQPTNGGVGSFYVNGCNATTCTLNLQNSPGAVGANFAISVNVAQ